MKNSSLNHVLGDKMMKENFALLYRPHITGKNILEIMTGEFFEISEVKSAALTSHHPILLMIPYSQLREINFDCVDDNSQVIGIKVQAREMISFDDFIKSIPKISVQITNDHFDISDNEYADIANHIIQNEIGGGEGSNFVIKRQFMADITEYSIEKAFSIFRNLLENERGAYWTFMICINNRIFIGASPELHVSLKNNIVTMNPISGTYRYPESGATLEGFVKYLSTDKERDELYMVVEEELKMISNICPQGGKVTGPFLKEMSQLAHTEYLIEGVTDCDPREILQKTMFAPTVTGSPIKNACRIIAKYEPEGRGYYSGVAALIETNADNQYTLDSTILIRTADISQSGKVSIAVGATIVRHSDPMAEADETEAKSRALLRAMNVRRQ